MTYERKYYTKQITQYIEERFSESHCTQPETNINFLMTIPNRKIMPEANLYLISI